ncbi:MAG: hypothetical protein CEE38_15920 [Planctomycetes bacterium B3_Pla]|nr:MAG: hypothetical protein CEE38_15920 [Planctomycetes bacterium B3_Pla]
MMGLLLLFCIYLEFYVCSTRKSCFPAQPSFGLHLSAVDSIMLLPVRQADKIFFAGKFVTDADLTFSV